MNEACLVPKACVRTATPEGATSLGFGLVAAALQTLVETEAYQEPVLAELLPAYPGFPSR